MRLITLVVAATVISIRAQRLISLETDWEIGQIVPTSSGPVLGQNAGDDTDVSEYLGIPYAKPPVGDLRFAAPEKFQSNVPLNATKFGASCHVSPGSSELVTSEQLLKANLTAQTRTIQDVYTDTNRVSEDCLYLNVWTKPQVGENKKAVMVWFYGGGFSFGSSSVAAYNGRNLAALEDVVVVSFNYRLNIFGFPAHPGGTYNTGILDQRLALEWVRDNIEEFGGDASRITIFGQSAGSASVDYHTYAWPSDPIASSAILQSGSVFSWGLPNQQSVATKAWFETARKLTCGNATTPPDSMLACMRTKSPKEIYAAYPSGVSGSILGPFVPTVDNSVVFSNYTGLKPADMPVLMGNNDYEAGLFRTEFSIRGINLPEHFWTDFNIQEFTCPCSDRANSSLPLKSPTWRYRYMGNFSNLALAPYSGSWHSAEIPLILDNMPDTSPSTPFETETAQYMRNAWSTFAKDPNNGLIEYGWPTYDPTKDTLIRIGDNNNKGPNLINPYRYDADCPFFNVSSTDPSKFGIFPDLGASVKPTSVPTATMVARDDSMATMTGMMPEMTATATTTSSASSVLSFRTLSLMGCAAMTNLMWIL